MAPNVTPSREGSATVAPLVDILEPLENDGEYVLRRALPHGSQRALLATSPALAQSRPTTLRRLEHAYGLRDQLDSEWSARRPLSLTQRGGCPRHTRGCSRTSGRFVGSRARRGPHALTSLHTQGGDRVTDLSGEC